MRELIDVIAIVVIVVSAYRLVRILAGWRRDRRIARQVDEMFTRKQQRT